MSTAGFNSYLETEVTTASPQRLRLMLIEAALRSLHATKEHWQANRFEQGAETIDRARLIVNELLAAIRRHELPDVTNRLVDLYAYLHKTLTTAGFTHDAVLIDDAMRILDIERETWKLICETLAKSAPPAPHLSRGRQFAEVETAEDFSGGLSIEA